MNTIQFTRKIDVMTTKANPRMRAEEPSERDLVEFMNYITDVHHQYIKENAIIIQELAHEVLYKHAEHHPELVKLASAIFLFLHDILNQLRSEEVLFANTKQLIHKNGQPGNIMYTTFGLIKDSVNMIQQDHETAQERMRLFRMLTDDYKLPENVCYSYKRLFSKLKEFERNYLLHIEIEQDILFPGALALDGEIQEFPEK